MALIRIAPTSATIWYRMGTRIQWAPGVSPRASGAASRLLPERRVGNAFAGSRADGQALVAAPSPDAYLRGGPIQHHREGATMQRGEQATGTPDMHFNLISVLYHALEAAETYGRYCEDAENEGDDQLVEFMQDMI